MSVGAELAAARERLGLSIEDVSQRTKVSVERLLAIERADLPNLPPLVYLKGFVREYAAAVKLDADEMAQRYLAEFDEPAGLISRESSDAVAAHEARLPEFLAESEGTALFDSEDEIAARPVAFHAPVLPVSAPTPRRASEEIDRVASGFSWTVDDSLRLPPEGGSHERIHPQALSDHRPPFRGGRVAIGVAVAVLAGILIAANSDRLGFLSSRKTPGTQARANTPSAVRPDAAPASRDAESPTAESAARAANDTATERSAATPAPAAPTPSPTATPPTVTPPARSVAAPSPNVAAPAPDVATPAPSAAAPPAPRVATPPPATPAPAVRVAPSATRPPVSPAPVTTDPAVAPAAPPTTTSAAPSTTLPAATPTTARETLPPSAASDAAASPSHTLTGNWSLTTRIEVTDVAAFENMNLGFRLQLQQEGDRITGRGLKWMENGKLIPERSRTPIVIEGLRRGNRLELRFTEHGTARTSTGTFVMDVGDDGTLRGQFASTSANSSGSTMARRVTPEKQ